MTASSPMPRRRRCCSRFRRRCGISDSSEPLVARSPMLAFETGADTVRTDPAEDRLEALGRALFAPTGSNGVHARTALFETAIEALSTLITAHREADTEVLRFAPVMSRHQVEK